MSSLLELKRRELVSKGRADRKRFNKRLSYKPYDYKGVNIKEFFEDDKLVFTTIVKEYQVIVSFSGALSELQHQLSLTKKMCTLRDVIVALSKSYDHADDVKVRCDCSDFKYRFMYWSWKNDYLYGEPDDKAKVPPKYDYTNKDDKGSTCKHLMSLLSNKQWLIKVASVINNYIRLYKDQTYDYLYIKEDPVDDPERVSDEPESSSDVDNTETNTPPESSSSQDDSPEVVDVDKEVSDADVTDRS